MCIYLEKVHNSGSDEINRINTFLYDVTVIEEKELVSKILNTEHEETVVIIKGKNAIALGGKTLKDFGCFFINDSIKIDDASICEIMTQLADNVDISELPEIEI
ncbi:hypothetical protein OBV_24790 [Oscillibacter valericigenes Sjm18-20]|nr:hypothetical protein OBV_24790 [Oscillibacter valericigenes Sjm18-20]